MEASLRKWMPPGAAVEPLALFRTIARFPQLSERLRPLGAFFLGHGALPARLRELAILRTCARCGAAYEWGVHVAAFARAVGLDEAAIHATATTGSWTGLDAHVIRAVDELHDAGTIAGGTWTELAAQLPEPALVELVALAGFYHLISFLVNALGVAHEPWAAPFPA
ncbi:MAG TPA: carboxymuconolactone decarboxylase family protein [Kofleriaceae bacterium]|nr:carboxymuconolactone decarboxylase family protein [Kofleriaceae bacterium]